MWAGRREGRECEYVGGGEGMWVCEWMGGRGGNVSMWVGEGM